jgi:hypothetical protein
VTHVGGQSPVSFARNNPSDFTDTPSPIRQIQQGRTETAYSNMLYFNAIARENNVSHFTYDLYFYIDNPNASHALEFDINQTDDGKRWVWGSECNRNGSGMRDTWDDIDGWKPNLRRQAIPSNTWIHLMWNVEQVGNQVNYVSLTVSDQTYDIDTYYHNQPGWTLEEIDVAFQMDGNYKQEPYNVWARPSAVSGELTIWTRTVVTAFLTLRKRLAG